MISWSPPAACPSSFRRNVTSQHPLRNAPFRGERSTSRRSGRCKMSADSQSSKSLSAGTQNGRLDGFGRLCFVSSAELFEIWSRHRQWALSPDAAQTVRGGVMNNYYVLGWVLIPLHRVSTHSFRVFIMDSATASSALKKKKNYYTNILLESPSIIK